MNVTSLLRAFTIAAAFGATSAAHAGAITDPASWLISGNADTTTVTSTAGGANLFYAKGTYFCAGCGDNYFKFETTVDRTGTGGLDFSYNAFNGWYLAASDLTILVNDVAVAYFGNNAQDTFSYAFTAGDILGFIAHEYNYDSQDYIDGNVSLSKLSGVLSVPEPGSLALMGLGLLAAVAARRKSMQ